MFLEFNGKQFFIHEVVYENYTSVIYKCLPQNLLGEKNERKKNSIRVNILCVFFIASLFIRVIKITYWTKKG